MDNRLEGTWRMTGQDIFMRWDDGMRTVLSPVGQGFLLYHYKPGRPLDGVPTRIFAATPNDAAKFAAHMQGRQDVAQQMRSLAEAAGVTTNPVDAGWGQTFMRWAWPFSEDEQPQSTEALLQESYQTSGTFDPWWWPFWSEKPNSAALPEADATTAVATDIIEIELVEATTETDITEPLEVAESAATATDQSATIKPAKRNWQWPF